MEERQSRGSSLGNSKVLPLQGNFEVSNFTTPRTIHPSVPHRIEGSEPRRVPRMRIRTGVPFARGKRQRQADHLSGLKAELLLDPSKDFLIIRRPSALPSLDVSPLGDCLPQRLRRRLLPTINRRERSLQPSRFPMGGRERLLLFSTHQQPTRYG